MVDHHVLRLLYGICLALFLAAAGAMFSAMPAQAEPPAPGDAILPNEKPAATPVPPPSVDFVVERFRTDPAPPRIEEPFKLRLEIKNTGTMSAVGWNLEIDCAVESGVLIVSVGACIIPLPETSPGDSSEVDLSLRAFSSRAGDEQSIPFNFKLVNNAERQSLTVSLYFLPKREIPDEKPALVRPFPRPDILIQDTWTAKARATSEQVLTPVPLVINSIPISNPPPGGPEFDLVVRLRNQGEVGATNIFVNFCGPGSRFNPTDSGCRKHVPSDLHPGGEVVTSQTLAYNNSSAASSSPGAPSRGEAVTLAIAYDFWYVEQWVQETVTQTVYIYPQFFPAATPVPALQTPYLIVNTPVLNVRQGPDTNYFLVDPVSGFARGGEIFQITGQSGDWWQINFRGLTAWVSAYYVVAWGGERVPTVTNLPPAPPAAPPLPATPRHPPPPGPVGRAEPDPALADVSGDGPLPAEPSTAQTEGRAVPGELVLASQTSGAGSGPGAPLSTVSDEPLVVVERYQSTPDRIGGGQPFELEVVLRNTGQTTARQVILGWRGDQVAPVGAGTTRWLDDLAPGEVVIVSGHFLLTEQSLDDYTRLPLELHYTDSAGQLVSHEDEIVLLKQGPDDVLPATSPAPPVGARPLWLRVLLGLLGLGAGPQ